VFGASGYAGALAAHLLWRHPFFDLVAVTSRTDAGRRLDELYPRHRVPLTLEQGDVERLGDVDAALVAYPHGASAPVVAALRERGARVVDLSADFRLHDLERYERWYGSHGAPGLLDGAVYGLPELRREEGAAADLVANPGCYPTAALLALAPLARAGAIADVIVDAKSGVSGAGREANQTTHFVSADENVSPYGVAGHRHAPEIDQELEALGASVRATFIPHLLPLDQGELVSCYVTLAGASDQDELAGLYADPEGFGRSLGQAAEDLGLTWRQNVSELARSRKPHAYTITHDGERLELGPHVAIGSGSGAGFIARIYLHVADGSGDVARGLYVGHVGRHLPDTTTA
jgi:N-acetyl-gamma-glutamyl-phosphate reductase